MSNLLRYAIDPLAFVTLGRFFDHHVTSHTAIEAIGGLNLPGGGAKPPFAKNTLREVKLLSFVKKLEIPKQTNKHVPSCVPALLRNTS